jgi:DNA-binding response OmpR family regulator
VLAALMKRLGRTVTREALVNAVYSFDAEIRSNALDSHVSRLRRKLNELDAGVAIHTIRGIGYLMKAAE